MADTDAEPPRGEMVQDASADPQEALNRPSVQQPEEELPSNKTKGPTKSPKSKKGPSPRQEASTTRKPSSPVKEAHTGPFTANLEKIVDEGPGLSHHANKRIDADQRKDTIVLRDALNSLSDLQAERFEKFRRSHFDRNVVHQLLCWVLYAVLHFCSCAAVEPKYSSPQANRTAKLMTDVVKSSKVDKEKTNITIPMAVFMSSCAKVFVGEVVEEARRLMEHLEEGGPIQPRHLREAVRRLRKEGRAEGGHKRRKVLR